MEWITSYFESQMDFVYLISGLAFLMLGMISYPQARAGRLKLPWGFLAAFGVLHGLGEWVELLTLSFDSGPANTLLRFVLTAASYVALVEFDRRALSACTGKHISPWLHAPLAALTGLGALAGLEGLAAANAYSYGLVSGLAAALTFSRACRRTKTPQFKRVAVLLLAYALSVGMVAPRAAFAPAAWLNPSAFQDALGLPIQLIRAVLIVTVTILLWQHDQNNRQALQIRNERAERKSFLTVFLLVNAAILLLGWGFTQSIGHFASQDLRKTLLNETHLARVSINRTHFTRLQGVITNLDWSDYLPLRADLMTIKSSDPQLLDVYLMKLEDDQIIFIASGAATTDPVYVDPGVVYENPPEALMGVFSGSGTQIIGPYTDEYGTFVSSFTPVTNENDGKLIGVLGLDLNASYVQQTIARYRLMAQMITLLAFSLATAFFISRVKSRETTQRIEQSEKNLAVAQALAHIGSWSWNLLSNELDWSQEMYRIFGQPSGQPVQTYIDFSRFFSPTNWEKFAVTLQNALQTQQDVEVETEILRPDSEVRIITTRVTVRSDEQDSPVQMLGITRDITEQKEADERVRKLSRAIEQSPVSIVITDTHGAIEYVNPHFTRVTGYTLEEAIGNNPRILKTDETAPSEYSRLWETILSGRVWQGEFHNRRKNGELFWESAVISPVLDENQQVTHFVAVKEDITERKMASLELHRMHEELEKTNLELAKASQVKSQFLANMSHEIRTPLNAIIGMTGLLLDTPLDQEQRYFADTVRGSGEVLLTLINDILDFSKIEAQKMELEKQTFDLRRCMEEALDLTAPKASEKKIELAYMIENDLPVYMVGDVTRLRQILVNLLSNAVKFTENGEVVVSLTGALFEGGQYQLHFSVRDTGMGIPPDRMNRLFQSFSQVDASTTRKFGGTGLGLAISKRLCEMMGGSMWAESSGVPGEGSTFHFTILLHEAEDQTPEPVVNQPVDLTGLRVMIVDDNRTNREILLRYLSSWKMVPTAYESGPQALEQLESGAQFDLAILDMQMPEMDGVNLCRSIQDLLKDKSFPSILLSSLGYHRAQDDEAFFTAYLTKPIKPSILFDSLASSVNRKSTVEKVNFVAPISTFDREMGQKHPLHLLVVEDNTVNQTVALSMLGRIGYRADLASNGIEALQALERQTYDVVLMDGQMPEMDGEEATRQIRRRLPSARQPRIIAMTANAMQGDRERYLEVGMDDYISKPIRMEELVRALSNSQPLSEDDPPAVSSGAEKQSVSENAQGAPVDFSALREFEEMMGEGGAEMVRDLVQMYLQNAAALIAEMHESKVEVNYEVLRRAAHTLKGNSHQVGAGPLAEHCAELEKLAKAASLEGADALLVQIQAEYQRVNTVLQKYIQTMS